MIELKEEPRIQIQGLEEKKLYMEKFKITCPTWNLKFKDQNILKSIKNNFI